MTLVLVTHDPALAARCERQVAMRSGRIETRSSRARRVGLGPAGMTSTLR
jgi:putative ABC transport system ATP-binding protein